MGVRVEGEQEEYQQAEERRSVQITDQQRLIR